MCTYLQDDCPRDVTQVPPFLQGLGEHDTKPETQNKINYFRSRYAPDIVKTMLNKHSKPLKFTCDYYSLAANTEKRLGNRLVSFKVILYSLRKSYSQKKFLNYESY